ncbi:ParA family protein [Chitinophaga nivalis]|uniref:ParA family protein n=1 Tax=Chitinophaga nivalis TaxID=2991709 RepID=A0ABT3IP30_9BACT|nr:ParA family protein [Chitinophaga nivalis]MCW3464579.1 ParA family protein [Chitinophaga nivalis]MCW3485730.1 ParA family protein [Chitinophaga nivalis]
MLILSIAIQKGGSGKTTTALNLAAALHRAGKQVLLVDLDPQANLTQSMGVTDDSPLSIYELLKQAAAGETIAVEQAIVRTGVLPLIPANLELAGAELELVNVYGREQLLKQVLKQVWAQFDIVVVDCPPALGMLTVNALTASDYVLLPLQTALLPFKGVQQFMKNLQQIRQQLNKKLKMAGLVLTQYDEHKSMHRSVRIALEKMYPELVLSAEIRSNVALARAREEASDIFTYDSQANGAKDYYRLATEVAARFYA